MIQRATFLAALTLCAAIGAAHGAAAAAAPTTAAVAMRHASFDPARLSVLSGDSVRWTNTSDRAHTLRSNSAGFDAGRIQPGRSHSWTYSVPGLYPYLCGIHPGMTGEIGVYALLLEAPRGPLSPGSPALLTGRSAAGAGQVTIEEDRGSGFRAVATAAADSAGHFRAVVRPTATAQYRALSAGRTSPAVRVVVAAPLTLSARAGKKRVRLAVAAASAPPGTVVALQYHLRERFGWWRVRSSRLGAGARVNFRVRRPSSTRLARAVLVERDGVTVTAVSNVVRLRPRRGLHHRQRPVGQRSAAGQMMR